MFFKSLYNVLHFKSIYTCISSFKFIKENLLKLNELNVLIIRTYQKLLIEGNAMKMDCFIILNQLIFIILFSVAFFNKHQIDQSKHAELIFYFGKQVKRGKR